MSLKGRTAQASLRMPSLTANVEPVSDGPEAASVQPMTKLSQLMELAAARTLRPVLRDGETSVALTLEFTHVATFPSHGNLRAVATYQGANGRTHRFVVHVFDESGLVASGELARAIVADRRVDVLVPPPVTRAPILLEA